MPHADVASEMRVEPVVPPSPHVRALRRRRLTRRVRAVLAALVVVALVVGAGRWGWWRAHPTAFVDAGYSLRIPTRVGVGTLVPLPEPWTGERGEGVVLDSVELDAAAPPGVQADVWVCRGTRIAFRDGLMAGARGTLSQFCRRAVPVAGQALVGGARDILLLRVRADRPAVLRVDDVRVRYRVGSQHGTQVVPVDLVASFRRHAPAS